MGSPVCDSGVAAELVEGVLGIPVGSAGDLDRLGQVPEPEPGLPLAMGGDLSGDWLGEKGGWARTAAESCPGRNARPGSRPM